MGIEMGRHAAFRIEGRVTCRVINPTGWGNELDTVTVVTNGGAEVEGVPVSALVIDAPAVSPDAVDRMVRLVHRFAAADGNVDELQVEAKCLLKYLPPEPVDPLVQRARDILAAELEAEGESSIVREFRDGKRDGTPAMRAVLAALRDRP